MKLNIIFLIAILVLAFGIRLYYFDMTQAQALWWDEAEYMSAAKHWAFGVPYEINPQRPPLFMFLSSLVFQAGLGELFIKFVFVLLPSVILVYLIYLLGKEMYDEKIGLIAAFLGAISWTFIFWSLRAQPDSLSVVFQVASVLFMWKYWKTDNTKAIILAGLFSALGFYFKVSALLIPLAFLAFILIKDRLSAFTNKKYYYFAITFLLTLVPYFVYAYLYFGKLFTLGSYNSSITSHVALGWYNLQFFYLLTENILFILFLFGLVLSLKVLIVIDVLLKERKADPNLFSILLIVIVSVFYIAYIRGTEDRWVFIWLPFIFFMIGNALMFIYECGKVHAKYLMIALIIGLLALGGFMQYQHADNLIKTKKDSYMPVKLGALWIKENSNPNDVVFSISYTQTVYYSERNVVTFSGNQSEFEEMLRLKKPRYLMISIFEQHPDWMYAWVEDNPRLTVVKDFTDGLHMTLAIYEMV
jgi:4-amino-4-deoxy-L-arabinose transferase-like glycosyltransferase